LLLREAILTAQRSKNA